MDSAYGGKAAASGTLAGGTIAATTSLGLAVGLGGTALGAVIIRYGTGDALYYGLAVAGASIEKGMQISEQGYEQSTSKLKQDLDPSISYRFVRYLPEYLWMGWSDRPVVYPVRASHPSDTNQNKASHRSRAHISHSGASAGCGCYIYLSIIASSPAERNWLVQPDPIRFMTANCLRAKGRAHRLPSMYLSPTCYLNGG